MRSFVVKYGIEMEEESISLSENNMQAPASSHMPPPRGDGRRVFNSIPVPKKANDNDDTVIISEDTITSEPAQAKPFVFPTLNEKEIEYANSEAISLEAQQAGQQKTQREIEPDNTFLTEPFDAMPDTPISSDTKSLYDDMVAKAIAEASRILEEAHAKAQIEHHQLIENSKIELEIAKGEAFKQGVTEGTRSQVASIRACIEQLEHTVARIEGKQEEYFATCEQDTKWLTLEICQKVLNQRVSADELALYPLVAAAVAKQKNAQWITVEISDDAPELLKTLKAELEKGDEGSKITVNAVQAPMGTCRMQTPDGFIDASLYRQLDNLREYFSQQPE